MSTKAYDNVKNLCRGVERLFASAVCSGIVGDARHKRRKNGTYHLSRQDNPPGTYSVIRPDDKAGAGPNDAAAAFDISMNANDLALATRRLKNVWGNDGDPRRKYLNAFNGWVGSGDAQRFDMVTRKVSRATPDHRPPGGHLHTEIRRRYVLSGTAVKAILSALRGDTVTQYLLSVGIQPATPKLAAPPYPGRVLRRTSATKPDPAVKAWQAQAIARGWKSIGKADGKFGSRTEAVVRRLQKLCKVPADGVIGPVTWSLPWSRPLG